MARKKVPLCVADMSVQIKEFSEEITKDMKDLIWILGSSLLYIQKKGLEKDFNKFMEENEKQLKKGFNLYGS